MVKSLKISNFTVALITPRYKSSKEVNDYVYFGSPIISTYKKSIVNLSLGVVKGFGNGKVQPIVRGGAIMVGHFGVKENLYWNYHNYIKDDDVLWNGSFNIGGYIGAGVQIPIGKHYVRLHGDV